MPGIFVKLKYIAIRVKIIGIRVIVSLFSKLFYQIRTLKVDSFQRVSQKLHSVKDRQNRYCDVLFYCRAVASFEKYILLLLLSDSVLKCEINLPNPAFIIGLSKFKLTPEGKIYKIKIFVIFLYRINKFVNKTKE